MAMVLPEKWYRTKFVGSPTPSGNSIQLSPGVRQGFVPEPTCGYPALLYSVLVCAYSHLDLPGCHDAVAQIFDGHTISVPCMLVFFMPALRPSSLTQSGFHLCCDASVQSTRDGISPSRLFGSPWFNCYRSPKPPLIPRFFLSFSSPEVPV